MSEPFSGDCAIADLNNRQTQSPTETGMFTFQVSLKKHFQNTQNAERCALLY